jgi:hypothetical protein
MTYFNVMMIIEFLPLIMKKKVPVKYQDLTSDCSTSESPKKVKYSLSMIGSKSILETH